MVQWEALKLQAEVC